MKRLNLRRLDSKRLQLNALLINIFKYKTVTSSWIVLSLPINQRLYPSIVINELRASLPARCCTTANIVSLCFSGNTVSLKGIFTFSDRIYFTVTFNCYRITKSKDALPLEGDQLLHGMTSSTTPHSSRGFQLENGQYDKISSHIG